MHLRSGVALLVAVAALALPAGAALAQSAGPGNPLSSPGLPQNTGSTVLTTPTTTTSSVPLTTTTAGTSSVSGSGIAAIAIGAIVILVGIAFFIWRDARKRAPVKPGVLAATPGGGSKPRAKSRKLSPQERRRRKRGRAR